MRAALAVEGPAVQQAACACSDYFRWNEFLTGSGNDHAEGGWSDRDYYGLALAHEADGDLPAAMGAMRAYLHLSPADDKHRAKARSALWEWEAARTTDRASGTGVPR